MSEKIAVVTGCSKGIGLATAKHLCSLGYKVFALSRNKELMDKEFKDCSSVITYKIDLCENLEIDKFAEYLNNKKIDILVNNAGGGGGASAVGGNNSGDTPGAGGNGTASSISGSSVTYAGGGGAGGYVWNSAVSVVPGTSYAITVGAGGASVSGSNGLQGNNGNNSSIAGSGFTTVTADAGGGGGYGVPPDGGSSLNGRSGGCGGGGGKDDFKISR